MAEVPEVEIIVRDLREAVVGRAFASVDVLQPAAVRFPAPTAYTDLLHGRTIVGAERRAKHILLPLSDDLLLEMHFMLWGYLRLHTADAPRTPETLAVLRLADGDELHFCDTLGYARTALAPTAELTERLNLDTLGPDALDPTFTVDLLQQRLGKRRGVLKTTLLNQRVFAGLGNRDADESMWAALIDPCRATNTLSPNEITALHRAICAVLTEGVELRGTQHDLFGRRGKARHRRNVFEQAGKPCPRCGTRIERLRIGGRNTFRCPQCQH